MAAASMSKSEREIAIFKDFLGSRSLRAQAGLVESRPSPEPDILFNCVAFELAEICAEDLAKAATKAAKSGQPEFTWSSDPTRTIVRKKLNKRYVTSHPVELLLYTDGRVVSPDDMILREVRQLGRRLKKKFRRVWLLGRKGHYLVCDFAE
jgi:hypothetical protein